MVQKDSQRCQRQLREGWRRPQGLVQRTGKGADQQRGDGDGSWTLGHSCTDRLHHAAATAEAHNLDRGGRNSEENRSAGRMRGAGFRERGSWVPFLRLCLPHRLSKLSRSKRAALAWAQGRGEQGQGSQQGSWPGLSSCSWQRCWRLKLSSQGPPEEGHLALPVRLWLAGSGEESGPPFCLEGLLSELT